MYIVKPIQFKNLLINITDPGIYYINASIDDKLICSKVLLADTEEFRYCCNPLFDEQIECIKKGRIVASIK